MSGAMRQLEERQLPAEVTIMRWSPKMDLLAVANKKGEVALHRLTWQRVWLLSPQDEADDSIANLAWRPDGKLLAVSYTNSRNLCLVDIENKNILHKKQHESEKIVTCMSWLPIGNVDIENFNQSAKTMTSPTGEYLPPLPSLNRGFGQEPDRKDFLFQTLDMLFVGLEDSGIAMYVFGMFYCGTINIEKSTISDISGGAGGPIWAKCHDANGIKVYRLSCPLLERSGAFLKIAQIQANIECLMDYLSHTLMAISEAWETILLEMDEKLARYAETNPPCAMAADFLELLMIGIPTQKLENFLLRDLTEKGLKKLGHSIEMCYSNIQKLVLKHLSSVGMALVYQLSEMRGMARLGGPYESLGLKDDKPITNGIHAAEAFLAKSSEIQQVIDHSMRDYKAFFRWLYVVIARLTDERVPSEASRVSQQELTFIAEFLRGFDKTGRKDVNLEKLGQYLRRDPLQTCLTAEGSEWATMLDDNKCLREHSLIVVQDLDSSLLRSHDNLVESINSVFSEAYQSLVGHFTITSVDLVASRSTRDTQINGNEEDLLVAASDNEKKILKLFRIFSPKTTTNEQTDSLTFERALVSIDARNASFAKIANDFTIADLQFYSRDYLSLLLLNRTNSSSYLVQLPISSISFETMKNEDDEVDDEISSLGDLIGSNGWPRAFQGFSARSLAVSGQRKVAAVINETNRKIRLLETEVEPEDEEDEDDDDTIDESLMDTSNSNVAGTSA